MPQVKTLQIVWHEKEPVYSVDFHPDGTLATAGADKEIKLWEIFHEDDGSASVKHVSTLQGHSKTVNCVRFSPSGDHLVSGGDSGEILLWAPQSAADAPRGNLVSADETTAGWRRAAALRGHMDDVMDLSWAADGSAFLSGSIDNKAIAWEVSEKRRGAMLTQFANHKHFVQGVAWDPLQQFAVTQSADRSCKVYALRPPAAGKRNKMSFYLQPAWATAKEFYCANTLSKRVVAPAAAPAGDDAQAPKPERQPLFLDECIPSFFRRPAWSPDGSFLVLPAGMQRIAGTSREINTAYLYARGKWAAPVAHLPAQTKPVVAVRFCPVIFRNDAAATSPPPALFEKLPYKMVFAVATLDSVLVYDTSSALPLVVFGQLHYDSITDVAWSANGQYLAVASRDCYCSIATFQAGELGEPIALEELPPHMQKRMAGKEGVPVPVKEVKGAGSSPAEQRQGQAGAVAPAAAAAQLQSPTEGVAAASAPPAAAEAVVKPVRKRIVPEMMSVPVQAAAPAVQQEAGPSVPSAKKPKRCTPTLVQLPPAAPAAAPDSGETEKAPKRITPTPVSDTEAQFDKVKSVVAARPAEPSPATAAPASHRRITPVPVASSTAPQAAKKPAFSIAALAMAAGQKAAEQGKQ